MSETPMPMELRIIWKYTVESTVMYSQDGWVRFDGSQERIFLGGDCDFKAGDKVRITFSHA